MKKFINDPRDFLNESLEGILSVYSSDLRCDGEDRCAISKTVFSDPSKVSLVTGGGFGHVPLFLGFVGDGLCDGVAVGNVFTTPSASTINRVVKMVPKDNGILFILGNFVGDRINFSMVSLNINREGVQADMIVVHDDVTSAPADERESRRCIAGIVLMYKIIGAAAKRGMKIEELLKIARRVNDNMGSYAVALTSCKIPTIEKMIFELGESEMEHGTGMHGERGGSRTQIMPSARIAEKMVDTIAQDLALKPGERIALLVNLMGGTPKDEGFILYHDLRKTLEQRKYVVSCSFIDNYVSTLEMSGASATILRADDETLDLLADPAYSPFVKFN